MKMEYKVLTVFYLSMASFFFFVGGILNSNYYYCLFSIGIALFTYIVYKQINWNTYYLEQIEYYENKLRKKEKGNYETHKT